MQVSCCSKLPFEPYSPSFHNVLIKIAKQLAIKHPATVTVAKPLVDNLSMMNTPFYEKANSLISSDNSANSTLEIKSNIQPISINALNLAYCLETCDSAVLNSADFEE